MKGMVLLLCVALLVGSSFAVDIPDPVSFFDFEEADGVEVLDGGTAANNGEIVGGWIDRVEGGIVTKAGETGKCIEFVEEDSFGELTYVLVPYQEYLNAPNYTLSTWMLYTGESPSWGYLFWADGLTYTPELEDRHIDVWLHPYSDSGTLGVDCILHCQDSTDIRVANDPADTGVSLSDGEWHQVTVVLRDNITLSVYIDGLWAADDEGAATAEIVTNEGDPLYLGARPNDAEELTSVKIVGAMDRVRIWDTALDEEQIEYLYMMEGPEGGSVDVAERGTTPVEFTLEQNYPNPFNPVTTIQYTVPTNSQIQLEVVDTLGHQVATWVNEVQSAGNYSVKFDAENLASGVYLYRLTTDNTVETRQMLLVK